MLHFSQNYIYFPYYLETVSFLFSIFDKKKKSFKLWTVHGSHFQTGSDLVAEIKIPEVCMLAIVLGTSLPKIYTNNFIYKWVHLSFGVTHPIIDYVI